ncbi:hypothetical protein Q9Q94_16365 [Uliginosibacterium sp. 31-16]|uniref:hypothetical protein n=1 Tax=Uliginosibacterium sp. 31-16 TaxID=3068315 RepID=UPI0027400894|nr:hypothetical protein [Uliginosibacterium sp. 31-16]MDP5241117.1 hypothetical protein [Uliginosibacterium sp. 31-16]
MKKRLNRLAWLDTQPATIALDFIPQRSQPSLLGWLLLAAGLLATSAILLEYRDLGEQLRNTEVRLARETRHLERSRALMLAQQREKLPESELKTATQLAQRLHNRNLDVLAEIEAAGNEDVALLSLVQTAGKTQLKLTGEARSLDAAFAFARRLAARPSIRRAQVDSYEFKPSGSVEIVAFTLGASWKTGQ